jgi:hypothetical protein
MFGKTNSALMAAAVSVVLTLVCAVPLVWVDKAWTRVLSRIFKPMLKQRAGPAKAAQARQTGLLIR